MQNPASPTVGLAMKRLLQGIGDGRFTPGTRLPSERVLSESLQVSRTTIRQALRNLEAAEVLQSHPKRGWYVRKPKNFADRSADLESFTEVAHARGFTPSSTVIRREHRRATLDEAEQLGIPPGSNVIDVVRVRRLDGVPICVDSSLMAGGVCDPILNIDLEHESMYKALETLCGLAIFKSSYSLQAVGASVEDGALLGMEVGEPLLEVTAKTSTADGRTALVSLTRYRGDAYRFQADLFRGSPTQ